MIESEYAKFIVAVIGASITSTLTIAAPHSVIWNVCTVLSAALTAAAVLIVPNAKP